MLIGMTRAIRAAMAAVLIAGAVAATAVTRSASADTGAACTGNYVIGWQTPSDSPPDFGATVTVTNNSAYTIQTWTITWSFTAGQTIVPGSPYSANVVQNGTTVTATPAGGYNAVLGPGASTTWGFHGTYNGTSNPVPAVTCSGPSQGSSSTLLSGPLSPLGVNTASWDTDFVAPAIATSLSGAKTGLLRYPGGSYADGYLWQSNTYQGTVDPVDFAHYSSQVDAVTGGQKFVTVNYGSDTPASAGAWVKQASSTAGQGVALWEIGNEEYGSWEIDNHANPHTPQSYATNAVPYVQAMKAADPHAQVCYDYGMDGNLAPGAGVENWQTWNSTILSADAAYFDCADVHWYPINGVPTESTQSIMALIDNVPAAAAEVKQALSTYDPTAYFVVGETNLSQTANEWNEQPVGALFAAANALEWLSFGAQSVDWWDVHNYGTPTADFGMFSSGTSGEPAVNTPLPPYYGYQLASRLAVKGARVGTLLVSTPNIYSYYSKLPDGSYAVLLANADPTNASTVNTSALGITGSGQTEYLYDKANPTIATSAFSGSSVSVPAESVVVLTSSGGTPPTTSPTPTAASPTASRSSAAPSSAAPSSVAPSSAAPSSARPTTASPTPGTTAARTCAATYSVGSSWSGGFVANVAVTAGTAPISGWTVAMTLPGGTSVTNLWGGVNTGTSGTVRVANASYNGSLGAGASTSFGFQASGSGTGVSVTCSVP